MNPLRAWHASLVFLALALGLNACTGSPALTDLEMSGTETAAAPTPPAAPPAPTLLEGKRDCRGDFRDKHLIWVEDVSLTWQDNATVETGYRVYRDRILQDVLPPDSTQYHLQFRYKQGLTDPALDTFAVEAFRDGAASSRVSIQLLRCP